jgi:AcrR family transcriptional regulator
MAKSSMSTTVSPRAQQILDAAEALLSTEGYEALSAKAVADRAGVNKALVFYYWSSTDALFEKVLEGYYERHKAELEAALETGGSLSERLHRVVDALFDSMGQTPAYPRIVQHQISGHGPHRALVLRHLADVQARTATLLTEHVPTEGHLSVRHFHLSLSAVIINFFTYGPAYGLDPEADLEERRRHVHWLVDAWIAKLEVRGGQNGS